MIHTMTGGKMTVKAAKLFAPMSFACESPRKGDYCQNRARRVLVLDDEKFNVCDSCDRSTRAELDAAQREYA